jgi:predicted dehydrogenase
MSEKRNRVAVVGLGRMGSTIDDEFPDRLPPYSVSAACVASDRLEIVAGADIDPAKRTAYAERWGVQALYADYLEMIRQEAPDLVAICTKGVLHAEMSVAVAEANVPMIYCEKAIACSLVEANAVLDAVGSRGIPYNTGVLRRFNRIYHQARQLIQDGAIGEPKCAVHYARTNLLHGHIHSLDTLSFLLGDPTIVDVWGELHPRELSLAENRLDQDPNGIYRATTEEGVQLVSVAAGSWEFEVLGTQGTLRVLSNGSGGLHLRQTVDARGYKAETVETPSVPEHSATQFCLEDILDAYEQNRPTLGNIHVTHHITHACLAVAESHRRQRRVTLDEVDPEMYIFHV